MKPDAVAVAALVILLLPMGYFLLASPAFLLVKLDIPPVTQLLRGMFNIQFRMIAVTGVFATMAFLVAGRPLFAMGIGLIAALAIWGRGRFMRRMDNELSARDAGDTDAVRRLRQLHWSGMLCNATLVAALVTSIPYAAIST
ncbi:hypothetical protein KUL72_11810 [Bradyrhizobium arachidis]|uniref:hypothetical protein n=1 Tax=Bradyrhizobium TaxID=374 RepID=UPI00188AF98E|nr:MULTISPECIES: hypothetical protein [Bradyrhizobium]MDN4984007.1 hypothetical protein [Bradyrhizobium sp. WYCCWR 13022]QOZ51815.1 hypothetical protein XH90_10825 [Bradyrhizobium sp. CCBAU 53338]UVO38985.1 hypothetical protein KUL72_11810 [Bradyrhizobium arachidis]